MPWVIKVYEYKGPRCVPPKSWDEVMKYKGRLIETRFSPSFGFTYPEHYGERIIVAEGLFIGTPLKVKICMYADDYATIYGPWFPHRTFDSNPGNFPRPGGSCIERPILPGYYKLYYVNWCARGVLKLTTSKPVF